MAATATKGTTEKKAVGDAKHTVDVGELCFQIRKKVRLIQAAVDGLIMQSRSTEIDEDDLQPIGDVAGQIEDLLTPLRAVGAGDKIITPAT